MLTLENAIQQILRDTKTVMEGNGFAVVRPEGIGATDCPVSRVEDHSYVDFTGDKGRIRMEFFGNQALLYFADAAEEPSEEDFQKVSTNFFDLEDLEERDVKSLCNEFNENIQNRFSKKAAAKTKKVKTQAPVSRSAARNGSQSYDSNTLANRLLALYPELKEPYRENFEKYGDFFAEEFFEEHATPLIIKTIKSRNGKECNKLFRILNDIYESALNDTQSLIVVSILGKMENDPEMIETAKEYMCDDMSQLVVLVNKYLYGSSGKKALEKLKNPPPFKPKKEKKPSALSQMMGGADGMMPPM